jgi:hypothetical protein
MEGVLLVVGMSVMWSDMLLSYRHTVECTSKILFITLSIKRESVVFHRFEQAYAYTWFITSVVILYELINHFTASIKSTWIIFVSPLVTISTKKRNLKCDLGVERRPNLRHIICVCVYLYRNRIFIAYNRRQ